MDPDNDVYLSAVSVWEIAVKHGLGKLPLPTSPERFIPIQRERHGITSLPLEEQAILYLSKLPLLHARFLSEGEGFWDVYRATTAEVPTRGNLVPDAHLAALLRHHGVKTLYTHDRDFLKFPFLDVRDPLK